ncbi:MOSC domain-containing protein [Pelagibius sp. Alg239-R121]|uniref:MOSC domain-containing protein n=1 Tax=Pelagibius sp. Alg239-R121 TaxID=2993448 RepID=UPI0024A62683|nr:MOSC domain-containing protein [Pelagibius sp. Alg239-R121]
MGKLLGIARKAKSGAPMEEIHAAGVTVEQGLEGDYRGKLRRRQISVLAREDWEATCAEHGKDLAWTTRRANLLVEGVALKEATGSRLKIGDVVLEIYCETDPCTIMDKASPGLRRALEPDWRGGVCCRVIKGGRISLGDDVDFI